MALRGYLLARLSPGLDREGIVGLVRDLEAMDEVLFAEPLVGAFDLLATVQTDRPLEEVARQVEANEHVEALTPLKVNPISLRQRMWKNLDGIPLEPTG